MKSISRNRFLKITGYSTAAAALSQFSTFTHSKNKDVLTIGLCGGSDKSELAKEAGCLYIEAGVAKILMPNQPEADFKQKLESLSNQVLPIKCFNVFLPGELKAVGDHADHEGIIQYASTAFARAERVGANIIVFGSSGARTIPDGFDRAKAKEQFIALCKSLAPIAGSRSITLAVEQLNRGETNFINTMAESGEIVEAVHHPNLKMMCDVYHALKENDPASEIIRFREHLVHCHIAEKEGRTPPGVMGDDFTPYLRALKKINYRGRISLECNWKNIDEELPKAVKVLQDQYTKA